MINFLLCIILLIAGCGDNSTDSGTRYGADSGNNIDPLIADSGTYKNTLGSHIADNKSYSSYLTIEENVITKAATSLGTTGFSVNGKIQPHGLPAQYYFEYGPTTSYGKKTETKHLPPQLSAHYYEDWSSGTAGWSAGLSGKDLVSVSDLEEKFIRFLEPSDLDANHIAGIGSVHLCQYFYTAEYFDYPSPRLGGNIPDFRDAQISISLRGNNWYSAGTELVWWAQVDTWNRNTPENQPEKFSNWAYTSVSLTDLLLHDDWRQTSYKLYNDTDLWTYSGGDGLYGPQTRPNYVYYKLDDVLKNLNTNIFHMLTGIDWYDYPTGTIDFDNFSATYRNYSLLINSNGGRITKYPTDTESSISTLTDGWRNGNGKMWLSKKNPSTPQEFIYSFDNYVSVERIQVHQNPLWPSKEIEVMVSENGTNWKTILHDILPKESTIGNNFNYLFKDGLLENAKQMKFIVKSGYNDLYWGIGEFEVFGTGAKMKTDDDWYNVNDDIVGLNPGEYHYRVVAILDDMIKYGKDTVFNIPDGTIPEIKSLPPKRIGVSTATIQARVNTLGMYADIYVEYGTTTQYGFKTNTKQTGTEITPRTITFNLTNLPPNATTHYRIVMRTNTGIITYGQDGEFKTK